MSEHMHDESTKKIEREPYESKDDAFLEALAQDFVAGRVFHSGMIPNEDLKTIFMVFMPLAFMEKADLEYLQSQNIRLFYEYYDKAAPRSINGMPCFFSVQVLDKDDTKKMFMRAREIFGLLKKRREKT